MFPKNLIGCLEITKEKKGLPSQNSGWMLNLWIEACEYSFTKGEPPRPNVFLIQSSLPLVVVDWRPKAVVIKSNYWIPVKRKCSSKWIILLGDEMFSVPARRELLRAMNCIYFLYISTQQFKKLRIFSKVFCPSRKNQDRTKGSKKKKKKKRKKKRKEKKMTYYNNKREQK